jgi:tRNA-dihydrouridine synthase
MDEPPLELVREAILEHFDQMLAHYGEYGVIPFRKHLHTYSKIGLPGAGESGSDEAPGSDPVESVRAPEAVGQVVGEVHADLEGEGHNQCGQRPPPDDAVTDTHRH